MIDGSVHDAGHCVHQMLVVLHGGKPVSEHGSPFGRLPGKLIHDIRYFILKTLDTVVLYESIPGFDNMRKVIQRF